MKIAEMLKKAAHIETPNWPCRTIEKWDLVDAIGEFLRIHKGGAQLLLSLLESVPPDRTEAEYRALKEKEAQEHEAGIQAAIADFNARRAALGLPPVDRHLNIIGAK